MLKKKIDKNEYKITSVFLGVSKAEFARASFKVPEGVNIITPYSNNNISKKEIDGISFYAFSVTDEGVKTSFYIQPSTNQDISIGVSFIYAVGEKKISANIENLIISIRSDKYASYQGVTPEDASFVIKDLVDDSPVISVLTESKEELEGLKNKDNQQSKKSEQNISKLATNDGNYSIQLLSLSDYSDLRVMAFCIKHKIKAGNLIKRNVGNLTKVSIGKYSSKEAASQAKEKMVSVDALLKDVFVIQLNQ